jgi:hypothetical protein
MVLLHQTVGPLYSEVLLLPVVAVVVRGIVLAKLDRAEVAAAQVRQVQTDQDMLC